MSQTTQSRSRNLLPDTWNIPWLALASTSPCRTPPCVVSGREEVSAGSRVQDAYRAAGLVLRDRLLESLNDTNAYYRHMYGLCRLSLCCAIFASGRKMDVKHGYYLSAEYLIGRHMQQLDHLHFVAMLLAFY